MSQTYRPNFSVVLLVFATLALPTGCGGTFSPGYLSSSGGNDAQAIKTTWQTLDMSGQLTGGRFSGFSAVTLDKNAKTLTLTLPIPATPYLTGTANLTLPNFPGAAFVRQTQADGSITFGLSVPLASLVSGVNLGASAGLPNGDALPSVSNGFSGGKMPAVVVTLPNITQVTCTVYSSPGQVGVYVSTAFDPMIALTYPIKSVDGSRTWGAWSMVPAKGSVNGGYFVSFAIPSDLTSIVSAAL